MFHGVVTCRKDTEVFWSARKDFHNFQIQKSSNGECWWSKEKKPKHMWVNGLFITFTVTMIGHLYNAVLPKRIWLSGMFLRSLDSWSVHHPPLEMAHSFERKVQRHALTSSLSLSQGIVREQEDSFEHSHLVGKETAPSDTNHGHVAKKQDSW